MLTDTTPNTEIFPVTSPTVSTGSHTCKIHSKDSLPVGSGHTEGEHTRATLVATMDGVAGLRAAPGAAPGSETGQLAGFPLGRGCGGKTLAEVLKQIPASFPRPYGEDDDDFDDEEEDDDDEEDDYDYDCGNNID